MVPSDKAFAQVKNILGKLDRNIDQVRTRRLNPQPAPSPDTLIGTSDTLGPDTLIGVPKAAQAAAPAPAPTPVPAQAAPAPGATPLRSAFGRAKPLIGDARPASPLWKTT